MSAGDERTPAARLFGCLLLRELDAAALQELRQPEVAAALAALDVPLPATDDLDALAAGYFAAVLRPEDGRPPLVQSLWAEGRYDGEAAVTVRRIADGLGLELGGGARGAAPDHLGCLLVLWAELAERDAATALDFARAHLAWVARVPTPFGDDFYAGLRRAAQALCADLAAG